MNTNSNWVFTIWSMLRSRFLVVAVVISLLTMTVYAASDAAYIVTIHDENQTESIEAHTSKTDPKEILKDQGIELANGDVMAFSGIREGRGSISIDRAFAVTVTADGKTNHITMTSGTVGDALKGAGITLGENDAINREKTEALDGGEDIVIRRISYETKEVRETVPFPVESRETPVLQSGKSEVLRAGQEGISTRVYTTRIVDGVAEEPELIKEFVERESVSEIRLVGANVPVSNLEFDVEIVNHAPEEYERVLTGCRATGYSAKQGAWGASGNHLFYGHVAVNPKVIPYGSKLYIASPDGKFVYGYAIASDTGVALMNGTIDVDLFYETRRESQLNGVRYVNIYVLSDDAELEEGSIRVKA